ncbi:PREDICTED: protein smoothened [Bactrocera latifrons]|uniref:protein smoothened n=1 Tax=Bactrocera latifrons TaxID=174628 RepID=UPI0008DDCEAF|nr:PREDICTED: protein smoothened [Bactrocera latifrons]XP_018796509.1 PREDICTED: protein smoothened [Bactrocera latifrons]
MDKWSKTQLSYFLLLCVYIQLPSTLGDVSSRNANTLATSYTSTTTVTIQTDLEPINGTINYRINGKKNRDNKPWFDGRGLDMQHTQCVRHGRCERLVNNTCFGANITYSLTSLDLTDYQNQDQMLKHLSNYRALRNVPKCWAVIQPFLCSVFMPKCEQINGKDMVYLPSVEMCRKTWEPCRILYNSSYFPEFLRCNETLFPPKCTNDVQDMKFNATGSCLPPLVPADSSSSYYPGIEGCGVQCKDPLYTDDEHRQIHKLISWLGTLCFLANLFVVATFIIDWENANKYPALIVFYINLCFMISCLGWLAQFTPGSREDIVCRKDGTLRHSEPTAGENLSCIVVFVLVYYFLTAAMVWFVFLTYTWHLRAVGNVQDRIDKKGSYFHLVAWSLPLVLTITTMALSEVDGNSTVGICFVGYLNHPMRAALLLGPLCGVILVGGYFVTRGMIMLFGLKHFANDIKSTSASNKIHLIIVRMGVCSIFTLIFILAAIACHVNEFKHSREWAESLGKFIVCRIATEEKCRIENRPSIALLQLHLICLFGSGIVMSTWCWTPSSLDTWRRYIRKKCGKEVVEEIKMPKHKVIAQTWAKRKEFEDKGRLSITLYNTHTDPVGLNFDVNDLNSSETNEISSTWANYLPQFVKRRMALTGAGTTNSSSQGPRKNSVDSEISFSVRHVSVESRRNSVDSQVSVKIAEMKTKVASRTRNGHHHHHHSSKHATATNKRTHKRRDFISAATTGRKYSGRRESSTSIESQVIALKKTTYPNVSHKVGLFAQQSTKKHHTHGGKMMKRRSANAGLDPADISEFLAKNGQLLMPFLQQQGLSSSSEEENSHASFKIHDSRLDVLLKQDLSDDSNYNDENNVTHAHAGARIEEINAETSERNVKKQIVLENLLKNMQKSNESGGNRNSRNSTRSRHSRKSQATNTAIAGTCSAAAALANSNSRRSQRSNKSRKHSSMRSNVAATALLHNHSNDEENPFNISDLNLHLTRDLNGDGIVEIGDSITSSCTSSELDLPLGLTLHSSYSAHSTGKPHSRNSKTSCDVGIQANAFEIATHNLSSYEEDELKLAMRQLNAKSAKQKNDYANEAIDATEMNTLLRNNNNKHRETTLLSESEKLKLLLLPSK